MNGIKPTVKTYLLTEFVDEEETGQLSEDTPLLSSGIIDSISALQLVEFLEDHFKFKFEAHEVDQDNLDTINLIADFVQQKLATKQN